MIFANTAHYIERRRDVHEELERLAIVEQEHNYRRRCQEIFPPKG